MMPLPQLLLCCLLAVSALADGGGACYSGALSNNWPQWRGPLANGVAPHANPPIRWSETNNMASNSPVTDGEHIYVFFGSRGLYCLDLKGDLKWSKDLGRMHTLHAHGEGSSPVLHGDTLIVCWDQEADSFLYSFDKRTGKQLWKVPRDEKTSWSTPLVVEHEGKAQVIVSATKRVRGYDPATGTQLWECAGLTDNVVSSPVHTDGVVIAGNSYE